MECLPWGWFLHHCSFDVVTYIALFAYLFLPLTPYCSFKELFLFQPSAVLFVTGPCCVRSEGESEVWAELPRHWLSLLRAPGGDGDRRHPLRAQRHGHLCGRAVQGKGCSTCPNPGTAALKSLLFYIYFFIKVGVKNINFCYYRLGDFLTNVCIYGEQIKECWRDGFRRCFSHN